jgi:superfamily II DNA or RNA helicase
MLVADTIVTNVMPIELSESFFAKIAGWEAVQQARALLRQDSVLSSNWAPPVLKGVVHVSGVSYRSGLVIKDAVDVENLCSCRQSREWGTICAHSVAVGLHHLKAASPAMPRPPAEKPAQAQPKPGFPRQAVPDDEAETALFVIFPPNLDQAIPRDKIMLCFEAEFQGRRTPLNALPKNSTHRMTRSDAELLDELERLAGGEVPALLMLRGVDLLKVLPLLVDHPRVTLGKSTPLTVTNKPWAPPIQAELQSSGEIQVKVIGQTTIPPLIGDAWVYQNQTLQPLGISLRQIFSGPVSIPRSQIPQFLSQDWPRLEAAGAVATNFAQQSFTVETAAPQFSLELKGGLAQLTAKLACSYGNTTVAPGDNSEPCLPDPELTTRYLLRDAAAERSAMMRLLRVGFSGPDAASLYRLEGQDRVLNFFARDYPKLRREWQVSMEERLQHSTTRNIERIEPRFEITPSGVQWFDFGVSFTTDAGERFSAAEIQRLILSGQNHTRLKNGRIALIDTAAVAEFQEALQDCAPRQEAGRYKISAVQAGFLDATLREHGWQAAAPDSWQQRVLPATGQAQLECPPLGVLESVLRPYQKAGVGWLHFLRGNQFGGILADEMGLGKTLQVLALLQTRPPNAGPALVVCPTSLVWNWVHEARKFTSQLKVLALHGPERHSLFAQIPQHDLIITSYALIRRDAERYQEIEFDTIALDEAQHIKNRQSQNAQAVKSIQAPHRLVLTGTPMENSVLDLWSIFDFLMPGYLGSAQDFRERYEMPIAREQSESAQGRLARRLRPFLLRRTKKEVAPELPEKLEQISFCELSEDQAALYQELLAASRREVTEAVGAQGLARSRMVVLNALLRLRQVCCDLRLLKLENAPASGSGKVALFRELLDEVIDGGHRVLVFSQFVSMLTLLRQELDQEAIRYTYLDGSTQDRDGVIQQFQSDPEIPVFLISLKAGGVGLNLTGADTVIHFDPWWNPAVEDQATARAHRIGQSRVVTSYKLITRGTVEEKILALQNRKREMISATIGDEQQLAEALSWEEIQELLAD